jgi:hypothetical protein
MPALVAGIHVFLVSSKAWMAGTSPAMTALSVVMRALGARIHVCGDGERRGWPGSSSTRPGMTEKPIRCNRKTVQARFQARGDLPWACFAYPTRAGLHRWVCFAHPTRAGFRRWVCFAHPTRAGFLRWVCFVHPTRGVIECVHRQRPARECASFVAVDGGELLDRAGLARVRRPQRAARVSHAADLDLRGRDRGCECETMGGGIGAGNQARQRCDPAGPGRIERRRPVEPVTARVLRRAGLAGRGARAGAALRVAAVGRGPDGAGHIAPLVVLRRAMHTGLWSNISRST